MVRYYLLIILLLILSVKELPAQQQKEAITIEQILTELVTEKSSDSTYRVHNKKIVENEKVDFSAYKYLSEKFSELEKINGRIVIDQNLQFLECDFPSYFELDSLHFKMGVMLVSSSQASKSNMVFNNVYVEKSFLIVDNDLSRVQLNNSDFNEEVIFQVNSLVDLEAINNEFQGLVEYSLNKTDGSVSFEDNLFNVQNEINLSLKDWFKDSVKVSNSLQINNKELTELILNRNVFNGKSDNNLVSIIGPINHLAIVENDINGVLELDCRITGSLELTTNEIQFIDMTRMGFSETHNLISFKGNNPKLVKVITLGEPYLSQDSLINWEMDHIGLSTLHENKIDELQIPFDTYSIDHINSSEFDQYYSELIRASYQLQNAFHSNGDIRNTNLWYVNMKEYEALWLKRELHNSGSFSILIRWLLNRLMKLYTEHGTDPGKATLISIWIIMGFGVVYLFFPSEWEKESKAKLLLNFTELIKKNDKGYFKPFLDLNKKIIVSYINALTLSLNAFVTLGFGRIPTVGIARYICVLEGFIGWFLLSLFTVALINQVLF